MEGQCRLVSSLYVLWCPKVAVLILSEVPDQYVRHSLDSSAVVPFTSSNGGPRRACQYYPGLPMRLKLYLHSFLQAEGTKRVKKNFTLPKARTVLRYCIRVWATLLRAFKKNLPFRKPMLQMEATPKP